MIDKRDIFEIHRMKLQGFSLRKISRTLHIGRKTVREYLADPEKTFGCKIKRRSKLDPYRELIEQYLEQDPDVKSSVIFQRLQEKGYRGKTSILRDYIHRLRGQKKHREPFMRFESEPGEQCQVDWGHFGSLTYGTTPRKLYALCIVESYSRMLYVEFFHTQKQEALHQGLLNAFLFLGGTTKEIVVDNMMTAVTEREGQVIRFNEAFLNFLRILKMVPRACHVRAPQEKGKIERAVQYVRQSFWPLRTFTDIADVNAQVRTWLDTVANKRIHQTTGEKPAERSKRVTLSPLPDHLPDCRETFQLLVHKDFSVRFDGNSYSLPPWTIGKRLTLKADHTLVTLYHKDKKVACHPRSFERKRRIETPYHVEQVRKLEKKLWESREVSAFASLDETARSYLEAISDANLPIKKNITRILLLKDRFGVQNVIRALEKALHFKAYGADYIENILRQEMTPVHNHPPVHLRDEELNRLRLPEPLLADYDAYILSRRKKDD